MAKKGTSVRLPDSFFEFAEMKGISISEFLERAGMVYMQANKNPEDVGAEAINLLSPLISYLDALDDEFDYEGDMSKEQIKVRQMIEALMLSSEIIGSLPIMLKYEKFQAPSPLEEDNGELTYRFSTSSKEKIINRIKKLL